MSENKQTLRTILFTGATEAQGSLQVIPSDQSEDNPTLHSGNNTEVHVGQEQVQSQITESEAA